MLSIDVVTLFPEMFAPFVGLSIVGRAQERGLVEVRLHNLLDALEPGERADDRPYGGGPGMVLRVEPIARILDAILGTEPTRPNDVPANRGEPTEPRRTFADRPSHDNAARPSSHEQGRAIVVTSPAGKPFRQTDAERFANLDQLILVCGHYEGIDERLVALYAAAEISLGDFVLTGGEIPALAILDATARLLAGAINPESLAEESFSPTISGCAGTKAAKAALDAPVYTRPASFRGIDVPEVLLSGDHAKIAAWRREQSRARTAARRPDLSDS